MSTDIMELLHVLNLLEEFALSKDVLINAIQMASVLMENAYVKKVSAGMLALSYLQLDSRVRNFLFFQVAITTA
jgi:hypothetical protein